MPFSRVSSANKFRVDYCTFVAGQQGKQWFNLIWDHVKGKVV